ncbi:MAG: S41 family peptidase [Flavobacteriaceae bacterium]|nr:S41 family peptidase [Flavobacteriaceae bacterium]
MSVLRKIFYFLINIALLLLIVLLLGKIFRQSRYFSPQTTSVSEKVNRLLNYIEDDYVDTVDTEDLLDDAIKDMLEKLDPHSVYLSKQEVTSEQEKMSGHFFGIGVQFLIIKDTIVVTKVLKNAPSEKAGVLAGDRIVKADEHLLTTQGILDAENVSENSEESVKKMIINDFILHTLRGQKGEKVILSVYRKSLHKMLEIPVIRGDIPIKSVEGVYMITPTLGYIEIRRFAEHTYDEFKEALTELIKQGMKSLVLDLRSNPGGYLKTAYQIADEFLEDGKLVVFTKNKHKKIKQLVATHKGDFEQQNIYVLIDQNSASASEIVAGALQDNDRGTIVGRRSFGKGLVQQQMDLGDGSAVRLTISRYYTPTGRSIQKPYEHDHLKEYQQDVLKRLKNGEMYSKDSIKTNDSLVYKTPKGKLVYGGGGIIPDVFVPIDSTKNFKFEWYKNLIHFSQNYLDEHRKELLLWTSKNEPLTIDKDKKILQKYLQKYQLKITDKRQLNQLHNYLKSLLLKDLEYEKEYYKIFHKDDDMIQKVIELELKNARKK